VVGAVVAAAADYVWDTLLFGDRLLPSGALGAST